MCVCVCVGGGCIPALTIDEFKKILLKIFLSFLIHIKGRERKKKGFDRTKQLLADLFWFTVVVVVSFRICFLQSPSLYRSLPGGGDGVRVGGTKALSVCRNLHCMMTYPFCRD